MGKTMKEGDLMEPKNLPRGSKTIRLPFSQELHQVCIDDGKTSGTFSPRDN